MKTNFWCLAALLAGGLLAACESDDDPNPGSGDDSGDVTSAYVAVGTADSGAYLLTADTFDEGTLTASGNGTEIEASSATTWVFYRNDYLYRLNYNMGQAGTTNAYYLDANGRIQERDYRYSISNFTTYGIVGNYIIAAAAGTGGEPDDAGNYAYVINFTFIDVDAERNSSKTIMSENFLGTGEYVTFSGILEANGKIYTAVVPLGCSPYGIHANPDCVLPGNEGLISTGSSGTGGGMTSAGTLAGTQWADWCWIAVFDDTSFTNPTLIKTDKLSYACGRMRSAYYQTIWAADNGDIYVFSPSYARASYGADDPRTTKHNSGVMRIKSGATAFDDAYGMVDIETMSGGHQIYRCWHICEDYFLLQMYTNGYTIKGEGTNELMVYKGETKSLKKVSGLPADLSSISSKTPYCENGSAYISIATESGENPFIYKIDMATAAAVQGAVIAADEISAVGKLVSK